MSQVIPTPADLQEIPTSSVSRCPLQPPPGELLFPHIQWPLGVPGSVPSSMFTLGSRSLFVHVFCKSFYSSCHLPTSSHSSLSLRLWHLPPNTYARSRGLWVTACPHHSPCPAPVRHTLSPPYSCTLHTTLLESPPVHTFWGSFLDPGCTLSQVATTDLHLGSAF